MTAQDIIYAALRRCGTIRAGYLPQPELLTDALNEWKFYFDGLNAERTMQYNQPDYVFPVTGPGHGTTGNGQTFGGTGYQIGPTAADFRCTRPVEILRMNLYMTSASPSQPTRIPMAPISMEEWMNIPVVQIAPPVNVATVFAYDTQYPNAVIWVWPPLVGNSLEIFTWGELVPPSTLGAAVAYPPAYADLLIYRLAQRMYHMVPKSLMANKVSFQLLAGQAENCAVRIRAINAPKPRMRCDFRGGSSSRAVCDWSLLLAGVPY